MLTSRCWREPQDDTAQYVYFHSGSEATYRKVKSTTKPPTGGSSSFTSIPTIDLADLIGSPVSPAGASSRRAIAARVTRRRVPPPLRLLLRRELRGRCCGASSPWARRPRWTRTSTPSPRTSGPVRAAEPWWRAGLYRYYHHHVLPLAQRLVPVVALALGLEEETALDGLFRFPITGLRPLYYPPPVAPADDDGDASPGIGLGAHADFSCRSWKIPAPPSTCRLTIAALTCFFLHLGLTLVLQFGDVPALEVLNPDGAWVPAPPKPGTLVCNVGQYLERQSNGAFPATVYRVRNRSTLGQGRYSLPFFLTPDPGADIEPVVDAGRLLYPGSWIRPGGGAGEPGPKQAPETI